MAEKLQQTILVIIAVGMEISGIKHEFSKLLLIVYQYCLTRKLEHP